tara:strand:- start:475 stop:3495 length:3021 start_codon:yes stop_codon:yes gene_type:complete
MKKIFNILLKLICLGVLYSQNQAQIDQVKQYMKQNNISIEQAKKVAKEKGYSDSEIKSVIQKEKIRDKEKTISNSSNKENKNLQQNKPSQQNSKLKTDDDEMFKEQEGIQEQNNDSFESWMNELSKNGNDKNTKYFGYEIFKNDPSIFQTSTTGAVDPNYLIGPGDEIIVMMWGETQFREVFAVNREGFIFIPQVGQVFVNGLNLSLLESKLFKVLSKSYATLSPLNGKATTFLDISLGNLRPLRIQVVGEVRQPGAYVVSPSSTLFSCLYYFNGPSISGTLRDIQLIRNNKKVASVDFYDFLLTGKKIKDEKLQLDDVVFIPKRLKTVSILGAINRPGIYELKPNETLEDLVKIAGGLKINAYFKRAQIDRIVPPSQRKKIGAERVFKDISLTEWDNSKNKIELFNGDNIEVFSIQDQRQNVVEIVGAVKRPGKYEIKESLTVRQLILEADSLLGDAYLERIDLLRINSDLTERLVKLSLNKILEDDKLHNISLVGGDKIKVYSISEMKTPKFVSIQGPVKNPGFYVFKEDMTLYDLAFKSGSGIIDTTIKDNIFLQRAELIRKTGGDNKKIIPFDLSLVLEKKGLFAFPLEPNDEIIFYNRSKVEGGKRYVSISGDVKNPGAYELFKDNMKISDILFKSGVLNDQIFLDNTYLERGDLIRYERDRINKTIIKFNINNIKNNVESEDNHSLKPGDQIRLYSKNLFMTYAQVRITGGVSNPGSYDYKTNMNLKDLILESGGFKEDETDFKIEIIRKKDNKDILAEVEHIDIIDFEDEKYFPSNIVTKNYLDYISDFSLKPNDVIIVKSKKNIDVFPKITVLGSVKYPGEYPLDKKEAILNEIILRAGGFNYNASLESSILIRNGQKIRLDLRNYDNKIWKKNDFSILNGDSLIVNSKTDLVYVYGEVNDPGAYLYKENAKTKYFIKNAGGLTKNAEKDEIYVRLSNGKSLQYSPVFGNHKILEGSTIIISKKKEKDDFNYTEYMKELTAIISNFVQAVSIIWIANR